MWAELERRLRDRRERLHGNLAAIDGLLARSSGAEPAALDLPGLAKLVENCYSDLEEVLKAIAKAVDGRMPQGHDWHRELLEQMAMAQASRPAVLDDTLRVELSAYLAFRHYSRNSTFALLDWAKMKPLVLGARLTFESAITAVATFLTKLAT